MRYDADALERLMKRKRMARRDVARLTGMHENSVRWITRGITTPKADTLAKLATALNVSVAEFFIKEETAA